MARFFRRGVSKIAFVATIADIQTPSKSELDAGVDLSESVAAISGFSITNAPIATPDLETSFDAQIDGPDTAGDSALTFYDDDMDDEIREALAKGTPGFVVLYPYGKAAAKRMEVWPVKSTGVNDEWSLDAVAAQTVIGFAVTSRPNQDAVVPTT